MFRSLVLYFLSLLSSFYSERDGKFTAKIVMIKIATQVLIKKVSDQYVEEMKIKKIVLTFKDY